MNLFLKKLISYFSSRKHSEERRISQVPSLDTIEDDTTNQNLSTTLTENYMEAENAELATEVIVEKKPDEVMLKSKTLLGIANVNLTESSSSGSVTDSVCTAYESNNNGGEFEFGPNNLKFPYFLKQINSQSPESRISIHLDLF